MRGQRYVKKVKANNKYDANKKKKADSMKKLREKKKMREASMTKDQLAETVANRRAQGPEPSRKFRERPKIGKILQTTMELQQTQLAV